jgi:hypothetical protein
LIVYGKGRIQINHAAKLRKYWSVAATETKGHKKGPPCYPQNDPTQTPGANIKQRTEDRQ